MCVRVCVCTHTFAGMHVDEGDQGSTPSGESWQDHKCHQMKTSGIQLNL